MVVKYIASIILIISTCYQVKAAETSGIHYFNKIFGHVHKTASAFSSSLTTISCGHPIKISDRSEDSAHWVKVKLGDVTGFIDTKHLSSSRPDCFQAKYPRFFNSLDLDLEELYFWGRLYDQYQEGESHFK